MDTSITWVSCQAKTRKDFPRGCRGIKALQNGSLRKSRLVTLSTKWRMDWKRLMDAKSRGFQFTSVIFIYIPKRLKKDQKGTKNLQKSHRTKHIHTHISLHSFSIFFYLFHSFSFFLTLLRVQNASIMIPCKATYGNHFVE